MFGSILGAAQLGPWVKKCEDLNSGPQHPYKKLGKAVCVSNPSAGVRGRERQIVGQGWGLT